MVSFFSFFTRKRSKRNAGLSPSSRPKSPAWPPSSLPKPVQRRSSRFLSLRSKSASSTKDKGPGEDGSGRRSSAELASRRSLGSRVWSEGIAEMGGRRRSGYEGNGGFSGGSKEVEQAPRLDLGFEVGSGYGWEDLGKIKLDKEEVGELERVRFGAEEVGRAWTILGEVIRRIGLESPGLLLPRLLSRDSSHQQLLEAFLLLSMRPGRARNFPTLLSRYTPSSQEDTVDWSGKLQDALQDTTDPVDIAEVMKWILRRFDPYPIGSKPYQTVLDNDAYTFFLQTEHAASYPLDPFEVLLKPKLGESCAGLLAALFEEWAVLATHADVNAMTAGRMCLLLGWWMWGLGKGSITKGSKEMYDSWLLAGRRTEHLFYAWIRSQSTRQKLPSRLLDLVADYPFGTTYTSADCLHLPPSSYTRRTLRVTLSLEAKPLSQKMRPRAVFDLACSSSDNAGDVPIFGALLARDVRKGPYTTVFSESLLAEESKAFLDILDPPTDATSPPIDPGTDALFAPHSDQRSKSYGDIPRMSEQPSETLKPTANGHSPLLFDEQSRSTLVRMSSSGSLWQDFEKIGFASPSSVTDLAAGLSPLAENSFDLPKQSRLPHTTRFRLATRHSPPAKAASTAYSFDGEEIVELDDAFMPFVEDGQMDVSISSAWPSFALVRLRTPFDPLTTSSSPDPADSPGSASSRHAIEWLLIDIVHRPPPTPPESFYRPLSPGGASTNSRMSTFSFRDFPTFRRSASQRIKGTTSNRPSIFGTSSKSLSRLSGENSLDPLSGRGVVSLAELGAALRPASLVSSPTNTSEFGQVVTSDVSKSTDSAVSRTPSVSLSSRRKPVPTLVASVGDTSAFEWEYKAEGGRHMVFTYAGSSPAYTGKVVRISKLYPDSRISSDIETAWRSKLLPTLLPEDLLISSELNSVSSGWVASLIKDAEVARPSERKTASSNTVFDGPAAVEVAVMDDITLSASATGEISAVEIKPKWGFLPSADAVTPTQSIPIKNLRCRYCMHQHLRYPEGLVEPTYCPLDLFSGDETRMLKALEGLWNQWVKTDGSTNNWRVYVDGKACPPEKLPTAASTMAMEYRRSLFLLIVDQVQRSDVMSRLKQLQSSFDPFDISYLAARWRTTYPEAALFEPSSLPAPNLAELEAVTESYHPGSDRPRPSADGDFRQQLVAFAISAIFKDCSIIIRIPPKGVAPSAHHVNVKLIDLDLKPLDSLRKWAELDERIWRNWMDTTALLSESTRRTPCSLLPPCISFRDIGSTEAIFIPSPGRTPPPGVQVYGSPSLSLPNGVPTAKPVENGLAPLEMVSSHFSTSEALALTPAQQFSREIRSKRSTEDLTTSDALAVTPTLPVFNRDPHMPLGTIDEDAAVLDFEPYRDASLFSSLYSPLEPVYEEPEPCSYEDGDEVEEDEGRGYSVSPFDDRQVRSSAPSPPDHFFELGSALPSVHLVANGNVFNESQSSGTIPNSMCLGLEGSVARPAAPSHWQNRAPAMTPLSLSLDAERKQPENSLLSPVVDDDDFHSAYSQAPSDDEEVHN